ncbi:hypothetical protein [Streptomyces sp. GZWMJZ-114]|uniref:hypothetical protein n=1 Tax=Streptomyces sp. GZWMJZ-114 TaxID=2494734 RepID=UPI001012D5D1|nr:hypothetical protein [Streptomyces sp. GZWMJZ-114]
MSNQPYDPYGPAQPRPQEQWPTGEQPGQGQQQGDMQQTQTWQAPTWETSVQPVVPPESAAEATAYLPPVPPAEPVRPAPPAPFVPPVPPVPPAPSVSYEEPSPGPYGSDPYVSQGGTGLPQGGPGFAAYGQPETYGQQGQGQGYAYGAYTPPPGPSPVPPAAPVTEPPVPAAAPAEPLAAPAEPLAAPAGAGPGFGPATLAGNTRISDAQRARAEGRSPIIYPGTQPAALTAALALLLAGGAALGSYALLLPLVVLQAVTAAGWFRLNGMWPARQGIALAFLGGVVADIGVLSADSGPGAIIGAAGVWVLLCVVLQLRSHASPDERLYGLMATVVSSALAVCGAGFLAADSGAVVAGALGVAGAIMARGVRLPLPASFLAAVVVGVVAGLLGGAVGGLGAGAGAVVGLAAALCAVVGHRVASYDYPSRFVHMTAGVALPLAVAAPVVWWLGALVA